MFGFFCGEKGCCIGKRYYKFLEKYGFANFKNTPDRISRNAKRAFAIEYEKKLVHHFIIGEQGF